MSGYRGGFNRDGGYYNNRSGSYNGNNREGGRRENNNGYNSNNRTSAGSNSHGHSNSYQRGGGGGSSGGDRGRYHNWGGKGENNSRSRYRSYDNKNDGGRGDKRGSQQPYSTSSDMEFLTGLKGQHKGQINSIVLDPQSGQLFTASKDGKVCAWDTSSGQCSSSIITGGEVNSMLLLSPWLFVGIKIRDGYAVVRAYNVSGTNSSGTQQQDLEGHTGEIYALITSDMFLFSSSQDKTIRAWKYDEATNMFGCVGMLTGHTGPVLALALAGDYLFSGSWDKSIRIWSLSTATCVQTIENAHTNVILSLLVWEGHLLSSSLDGDVKVWAPGSSAILDTNSMFTYPEPRNPSTDNRNNNRNDRRYGRKPYRDGALVLCGSLDLNSPVARPVLMVAYQNGTVGMWDLPSFAERGDLRLPRSCGAVRALAVGPEGLIFTGDSIGDVSAWKWKVTNEK